MDGKPGRRFLLGLPLLALAACQREDAGLASGAAAEEGVGDRGLTLAYLGAPNCPYCAAWMADGRPALLREPSMRGVRLVERDLPYFQLAGRIGAWPASYHWVAERLREEGQRFAVVPFFALVEERRILAWGTGTVAPARSILPALRRRLAA